MENSADPDQLASSEATDLDLHCLQRLGRAYPGSAGQGLTQTRCYIYIEKIAFYKNLSIGIL